MKLILIFIALVLGIARIVFIAEEPSDRFMDFFKDGAHLFVGGLFGAAFVLESPFRWSKAGFYSGWAWGLSILEILSAVAGKVF